MSNNYIPYNRNQMFLLPLSSDEFVPPLHLARVIEAIVDELDLSEFYASYCDEGRPAYHPKMMLVLLIYSYAVGVRSSRKIAQRLESDLVYLHISGLQRPDFRTISDFRKNHLPLFKSLFKRVVMLCHQLGMVCVGHIAIDGTKLDASASRSQRFTRARLSKLEHELEERLQQILDAAEAIDRQEDASYGSDKHGNELPDELADAQRLHQKIQEAKRYVEQHELSKVNLTDMDSRVMKTGSGGWEDGYNAQVAIDAKEQIIVAADVVTDQHDKHQFIPIYEQTVENLGGVIPDEVSADAGYASNAVYEYIEDHHIAALVPDQLFRQEVKDGQEHLPPFDRRNFRIDSATGELLCPAHLPMTFRWTETRDGITRDVHRGTGCPTCPHRQQCISKNNGLYRTISISKIDTIIATIRRILMTQEGRQRYLKRLSTVEPVFGQMKRQLGCTYLLLRGLEKVKAEFNLMCIVHNIRKLAKKLGARSSQAMRGIRFQIHPVPI